MANILKSYGSGGAGLTGSGKNQPKLAEVLRDVADDIELLRARFAALTAKLDADVGVTDVNYASTLPLLAGAIKTKKV